MSKDKVADEHPTSAKDVEMAIRRIWTQQITAEYRKHLVLSTPCRLQAVIKNKGEHTTYWTTTRKLANVIQF